MAPAVGGGLGLAMVPDLRVTCPEARFCANFTRLGFHPGFGLDAHAAGADRAVEGGDDVLHEPPHRRRRGGEDRARRRAGGAGRRAFSEAQKLAAEIAENSPLGVLETRATLRAGLADRVRAATDHELEVQTRLRKTADFKEGVDAVNERRKPSFKGIRWSARAPLVRPEPLALFALLQAASLSPR